MRPRQLPAATLPLSHGIDSCLTRANRQRAGWPKEAWRSCQISANPSARDMPRQTAPAGWVLVHARRTLIRRSHPAFALPRQSALLAARIAAQPNMAALTVCSAAACNAQTVRASAQKPKVSAMGRVRSLSMQPREGRCRWRAWRRRWCEPPTPPQPQVCVSALAISAEAQVRAKQPEGSS